MTEQELIHRHQEHLLASTYEYLLRGDRVLSPRVMQALMARLHESVELGMPSAVSMTVRAFRAGRAPAPAAGELLMRRGDTDFLWSAVPAS